MRRALTMVLLMVTLVGGLAFTSYEHARRAADALVEPLAGEVVPVRSGVIPFRRVPGTDRWGWAIVYGPREVSGHVGIEIFVAPFGGILGTNPPELPESLHHPVADQPRPRSAT